MRGVTVTTRSEAPAGAGIAGSSALNIAVTCALNRWTDRGLSEDSLLEIAKNVEAQVIRVPTGLQDYRPAFYGGIAALELGVEGAVRVPLDVPADDLDARLVVCYTGAPRDSGINNWEITKRRIDGDPSVTTCFDAIVRATADLRAALERGEWPAVGAALGDEWRARTRLAPAVTTPFIDTLLADAVGDGAWAGKVCGAGGGGCVFCLAPPDADRRHPSPLAGCRSRRAVGAGRGRGCPRRGTRAREPPALGRGRAPVVTAPVDAVAEIRRLYFATTKAIDRPRSRPRHRPAQAVAQ